MFKTKPHIMTKLIKPLDNQLTRSNDPLPKKGFIVYIFSGGKGSGKTTLILNLLKNKEAYRKFYDNIVVFSSTAHKDPKMDKLIKEVDSEGNYHSSCDEETIQEALQKLDKFNQEFDETDSDEEEDTKRKKKEPHNLFIFDDCIHMLPGSSQKSILNELFTQSRHYKLSIWIATQKMNKLNTIIRSQADLVSIWATHEKNELKTIYDWGIDPLMYEFATNEPNSFLHVSFFAGKPTYFKRFDKIILETVK